MPAAYYFGKMRYPRWATARTIVETPSLEREHALLGYFYDSHAGVQGQSVVSRTISLTDINNRHGFVGVFSHMDGDYAIYVPLNKAQRARQLKVNCREIEFEAYEDFEAYIVG